jgi:UDP-N-acetylmuramoyl-tripeptide--D-alanyl-D-alanine ligase
VAIAGSVGKTTTKDLITAVLSRQFRTHGTAGNLNNELGLPITLLGLHAEHDVAAVEIGISAVGEMATFAALAAPDVAVVTKIDAEHLEFLRDIDTVAHEEGVIVQGLTSLGTAVLNSDDPRVLAMAERTSARIVTFGEAPRDDGHRRDRPHTFATDVRPLGMDGVEFRLCHDGRREVVRLPLVGRHFVSAALAAAGAGFAVGCSWDAVVAGLQAKPAAPRIRVLRPSDALQIIDDTYNASPASCLAALNLLQDSSGTRVAVLGDMLELGDFAPEAHAAVGAFVARRADVLIAVGDASRAVADSATAQGMAAGTVFWVPRAADALDVFETWRRASGAVGRFTVLVKGSRGMRMELVAQAFAAVEDATHAGADRA